jgi:L-fuconate dehydratase
VRIERGAYMPPEQPGGGARILESSVADHLFPDGPVWAETAPAAEPPSARAAVTAAKPAG